MKLALGGHTRDETGRRRWAPPVFLRNWAARMGLTPLTLSRLWRSRSEWLWAESLERRLEARPGGVGCIRERRSSRSPLRYSNIPPARR